MDGDYIKAVSSVWCRRWRICFAIVEAAIDSKIETGQRGQPGVTELKSMGDLRVTPESPTLLKMTLEHFHIHLYIDKHGFNPQEMI